MIFSNTTVTVLALPLAPLVTQAQSGDNKWGVSVALNTLNKWDATAMTQTGAMMGIEIILVVVETTAPSVVVEVNVLDSQETQKSN